ncbi:MAG TPA: hypothetical protein VD866_27435 [Urbifossiella sp.]|nr:hypothetical protein [Urbifossiella sp.]
MPPILGFSQHAETYPGSDFTPDEWEFAAAVAAYQKRWGRRYPSWREVFGVLVALGYRKVAPPTPLPRMTAAEREVVAQARKAFEETVPKASGAPPTPPGVSTPG